MSTLTHVTAMTERTLLCALALLALPAAFGLDRRPTISFITQPEIVADIGGRVEMLCSVQYAQVPILPKATNICKLQIFVNCKYLKLQIFVNCSFHDYVTFS
jgi:hypothetical protein